VEVIGYVVPWVLASGFVGVVVGLLLGRGRGKAPESEAIERERRNTMKMIVEVLTSAERINNNVENHNTELQENARQVQDMEAGGETEMFRQVLLNHMSTLMDSNNRLQDDLSCTRYRLEEQAQEIDDVRREARTDELTSVANRKAFNEKLHILLDDFERLGDPFVLMLLDLDQFKRINDAHGHPVGDRVLKTVGDSLREWVREGDFVGRYGGDEFAVLLPKAELDIGMKRAEAIRAKMAQKASQGASHGGQIAVSVSVGVVCATKGDTADSILKRADQALYRSKNLGRNQVQCLESACDAEEQAAPDAEAGVPT